MASDAAAAREETQPRARAPPGANPPPSSFNRPSLSSSPASSSSSSSSSSSLSSKENRSALEHRRASAIYVGPSPLVQQHAPQGQHPSSSFSTASIPDQPSPPSARRHNGGLPSPPFTSSEGSGGGGSTRVVGDGPARASERREASRRGSVGGRSETSSSAGSGSAAGREERENRRIWELREKSGKVMDHLAQLSPATNRSQKQQSILGSGSPPPPSSPGGARASPSAFTFSRPPLRDDSGWSGSDTERERSQRHQKRASYSGSSTSDGSSSSLVGSRDGRREEFPVPRSLVARHIRNGSLPAPGSDGGWSSPRGSDEGSNGSGRAALVTSPRPPAALSRSSSDAGVAASLSPTRHAPRSPHRRGPSARDPPSLRTSALLSRTASTSSSHSRSSSLDGLPATLQRSQSTSSALSSNSSGSFGDIAPSSTEAGRRPSIVRIPSSTSSLVSSSSSVVRLRPSLSSTTTVKVKPREQSIALPSSTSVSSHASPAFRSSRLSTSSLALATATAAVLDSPPLSPSKPHRKQGESSTTRYQRRHSRSDSITPDLTSGGDDQLARQEEEERSARNGSGGRRRAPLPLDFRAEQQSSTYSSEPPRSTRTLGRDASSISLVPTSTSMSHRRALTSLDRDRDRAASPDSFVSARASLDEHQRSPRTASRVQQPSSSSSSSEQSSTTTRRSRLYRNSLDFAAGGDGSPTWFPSSSITSTQQRASAGGSEEEGSRASRRASTASSFIVSSSSHRRLYEDDEQDLFSASARPSANGHGSSTAGSSTTTGAGGRGDQPPTTRRRLVSTREMLERIERENAESEKRRRELLENQAIRRAESVMSFAGAGARSARPESVAGSTVSLSSRASGAAADFDRRFPPRTPVAMSARHHPPLQHFAASAQKAIRPSTSMAAYYDDAPRTAPPDGAGGGMLRSVRSIKNLQLEATASPSQLVRARRAQTDDSYQQQGSIRRPSTPNSSAAAAALARPRTAGGIEFPSSPSVASLAGGGSGQPTSTEHIRNLFEAFAQLEAYFRRLPLSSISGGADEDVVRGASKLVGHVEQTNASITDALAEARDRLVEAQVDEDVPLGVSEQLQRSYAMLKEVKRTSDEEVRGLTSLMISLPRLAKEAATGGEGGSNGGRATAMARRGDESPLAGRFDYPRSNRHLREISDLAGNRYDLSNRPSTSQGHTMMSSPSQRFHESRESPRPRLPSIPSMRDFEPPTVGDLRTSPSTVSSRAVASSTAASSRAAPSPSPATAATPARHKRPSVLHHVFDRAPTPTSPSSYDDSSTTTNTPVRPTRTSFTSTLRGTLSAAATSPGTPSLFAGEPTIALSTVTAAQTPASEYAPSLVGGDASESTTGSVGRWRTVSMFPTSTPSKAIAVSAKDEEATVSPVASLPTTAAERRQSLPQGQGQQQPTSPTSVLQRLSSFVSPKQGTVGLP